MTDRIRIEAPDALLGFLLLQRLPQVEAKVELEDDRWAVEITPRDADPEDLADALLETVRQWLRDEQLPETTLHVRERSYRITPEG